MKNLIPFFLLACVIWTLSSCEDDDTMTDPDPGPTVRTPEQFNGGAFVINQGMFNSGTGTLTFYKDGVVTQDLYQDANNGLPLGNIVQSMIIQDTVALMSINNGAAVVAASAVDLREMYRISDIAQPRYFATVSDDVAAVSYWGADGFSGGVRAFNIHTGETVYDIETGAGPEVITVIDGKLYIPLGNGFGQSSGAVIADAESGSILSQVETADGPHTIFAGRGDTIWIVAGGWTDFQSTFTDGGVHAIIDDAVVSTTTLPQGVTTVAPSPDGSALYMATFTGLLRHEMGSPYAPVTLSDRTFYDVAVDPGTGNIWACDAADFASDGEVIIFSADGTEQEAFSAGIIPGDVYFYE